MNPRPLVIYHRNCADGFTAAWAVRSFFSGAADFHPGAYGSEPPDAKGRNVILVDFSYPREVLRKLARTAKSLLVLDHHKSASDDLQDDPSTSPGPAIIRMDNWPDPASWSRFLASVEQDRCEGITGCTGATIYAYFDMNRSGAGIAWDFFHPDQPRPPLIDHVEDRDLWRFALPNTREIQSAVFSYPFDFDTWDQLMQLDPQRLAVDGQAIDRKHLKDVEELTKVLTRRMYIAGHDVPVASLPYTMTSDAGHLMSIGEPFAACYWDTGSNREFSLRSQQNGMDVAAIAEQFGGGGHKHAAGFRVPRDHELART
jgi:uncharacterized protein